MKISPRRLRLVVNKILKKEMEELRDEKEQLEEELAIRLVGYALWRAAFDRSYGKRQDALLEPLPMGDRVSGSDEP